MTDRRVDNFFFRDCSRIKQPRHPLHSPNSFDIERSEFKANLKKNLSQNLLILYTRFLYGALNSSSDSCALIATQILVFWHCHCLSLIVVNAITIARNFYCQVGENTWSLYLWLACCPTVCEWPSHDNWAPQGQWYDGALSTKEMSRWARFNDSFCVFVRWWEVMLYCRVVYPKLIKFHSTKTDKYGLIPATQKCLCY